MIQTHIQIGSQELPINFGLACLAELEQLFGCSVAQLGQQIESGGIGAAMQLIHVALKHGHRKAGKEYENTYEQTCDLLDEEGFAVIEQAFTLLANSMTASTQKKTRRAVK